MKIAEALEIFSQTHPGMVRSHNEDSVACEPACGLVVLADGMGGYIAGDVASGIAVSVVVREVSHRFLTASPVERVYPHPDNPTSHSTRLSKDDRQVAGFNLSPEGERL